ncbi:Cad96Ca, partial [Drosophila busckii]
MDYPVGSYQRRCSGPGILFSILLVSIATHLICTQEAAAQDQNAPPILYVRERNWRISEAEQVGQIIERVRAEDADGDDLVFGIEPRFLNPTGSEHKPPKLPFRIDADTGVVYLNESLAGRAGENFLIYITVSDGRYTAKNEVFINILGRRESNGFNGFGSRSPPSISNVVQNISQFLPAFDQLPGVQSIRNGLPHRRPSISLPPGFPANNVGSYGLPAYANYYPTLPTSAAGEAGLIDKTVTDANEAQATNQATSASQETISSTTPRSRTKLTPISNSSSSTNSNAAEVPDGGKLNTITLFSFKASAMPIVIGVCCMFAVVAAVLGYLCRRRLCAISKTLKKSKEKEELAKQSHPSHLSDDSRNSMVMQQWNGPVAFSNRYVPWERDQQLNIMSTSQLSTSAANGVDAYAAVGVNGDGAAAGGGGAIPGAGAVVAATGHRAGAAGENKSDRWEFPRHRLKFFNILGEGAFGQVWRCEATELDDSGHITTVAVKTLKESATEAEKKDLLSELEVMKSLEPHVNVVRFLGCCTDKDPTFVILEFVNRGKLQTYLRNSRAE